MPIEDTLNERGSRYGDFTDHAVIAQELQDVMRRQVGWGRLTAVQKQSLTVIADKQARILSGDPNYKDNWHDIQGYAKLAEDRCQDYDPRQDRLPLDGGANAFWNAQDDAKAQGDATPTMPEVGEYQARIRAAAEHQKLGLENRLTNRDGWSPRG